MFKSTYKHMYDQITPNERLVSATIASNRVSRKSKIVMPLLRKPAIVSIALALCILISIPALAANVPAFYEMLYSISPATAQYFKPVQKSMENNGIKMEVVSTYIHEDTAEVLISVQDLTGNRVDATTDLFDSYSIHRPFDSSATCQRINFDETTNTATFLISITEWGNKKITGDKITFSVREFISGKRIYDGISVNMDISNITNNPHTMIMPDKYGYGGSDYDFKNLGIPTVLVPSTPISFGVDGINISAMGYVDGMLHIQTVTSEEAKNDNHGYFYFTDNDGNDVKCVYSITFNDFQNGERMNYNEFVYDIPQSQLDKYAIHGYFVTGGIFTDGYWQVTFPLESDR